MSGRDWVQDLEQKLVEARGWGGKFEGFEERGRAVIEVGGTQRFLSFDHEGFNDSDDYVEVLEALAELARPRVELGPFEVRSTKEELTFRGPVAGEEATFTLPPITSDWLNADLLERLNGEIAARGVDGRFVTTQIWDSEIVFITAQAERALKRHPSRPIWIDEELPPSDPPEAEEPESVWIEVQRAASAPEWAPTQLQLPAELAAETPSLRSVTRHPSDPHLALRLGLADGATRAMLARLDGEVWFTPEGAVDMAWSPDGATTYVLRPSTLEAWVWGRNEVRASYEPERRAFSRVIVSPCGRFVALIGRTRVGSELVVLETSGLTVQRTHPISAPAAVEFTPDGSSVVVLMMDDPPSRMMVDGCPKLWLGSFHFIETRPDGDHSTSHWLVDVPAIPAELAPLRFDGRGAVVDVPGWGEVRGEPDE